MASMIGGQGAAGKGGSEPGAFSMRSGIYWGPE
jgi:hypothetical protein